MYNQLFALSVNEQFGVDTKTQIKMFKEAGFDGMIEFAKACKKRGVNVRFSIVDCIGEEEVNACKKLAQSVGIPLYIRDYITDS